MTEYPAMAGRVAQSVLAGFFVAALGAGLSAEQEREADRRPRKDEEVGKALAEVAAGQREPRSLRIEVAWREGDAGDPTTARVFGNGVGVWNDRVQIRLSPSEVIWIAKAVAQADFAALPARVGEGEPARFRGKIAVSIAGRTRQVVQLPNGEQSGALSRIASKVLDLARRRSQTGVTASSLADALAKVASRALAPEALRLSAQVRPEPGGAGGIGFLLRLEGRRAVVRPFGARTGYGTAKRFELSEPEMRSLAAALRDGDPSTLPSNLYAPDSVELRVEVLHWSRDVVARRSQAITRETQGTKQAAFDRILEELVRLFERGMRDGRAVGEEEPARSR